MNCHNGEKYLQYALNSIKKQIYKNYELIFWDNCSTDTSYKIFKKNKNSKFKYYKTKKKKSLYESRNLAIQKSSGSIITFLDVDDIWLPNKLKRQVDVFNKNPHIDIVYTDYSILDTKNKKKKLIKVGEKKKPLINLIQNYNIGLLTLAIRKRLFKKQKFNSKYNIIGDFDYVIKAFKHYNFYYLSSISSIYRVHSDSETNKYYDNFINELKVWSINNKILKDDTNRIVFLKKITYYQGINFLNKKKFIEFVITLIKLNFSLYSLKLIIHFLKKICKL